MLQELHNPDTLSEDLTESDELIGQCPACQAEIVIEVLRYGVRNKPLMEFTCNRCRHVFVAEVWDFSAVSGADYRFLP